MQTPQIAGSAQTRTRREFDSRERTGLDGRRNKSEEPHVGQRLHWGCAGAQSTRHP